MDAMDLGVHLPLLTWDETRSEPVSLIEYVRTAERLGFAAVSVNDHLQYRRPWLDGPTALASVVSASRSSNSSSSASG
jgi:alkanesulfonate monooxygenase SsuD/methylene tetrahydromethanopterin reductase-like flavin-dependent oxidoreductase (luciferase family)